jgi:ABC-2 type transport system ATP-binding protein
MDSKNIIEVKNLKKTFPGNIKAVDNISFQVKKGEMFAFLGPNGAGKTTTIKMLTTLLNPTSGKINLNGFDPTKHQDNARKSFGIVFQDPSLDNELTALENLQFHATLYGVPKKQAKEQIEYLMKFVGLWDRRNSFIKTFSGGMKRRLEIARGLIHHPAVLFLDEPTLGLDPQTRNHIWDYLKKLNKKEKMTVFFTTHYMQEAEQYASRVAIIDHGKIGSIGSIKEIKKKTKSKTLEQAFIKATGKSIREDESDNLKQRSRITAKMWGNR